MTWPYSPMQLLLLRHGEAEKNQDDRHGGDGTPLTQDGKRQMLREAAKLAEWSPRVTRIWFSDQVQVRQSVDMLNSRLSASAVAHPSLRRYSLGVLDGLSRSEAARLHPDEAEQLERWRHGELEVQELSVPGADDPHEFYERGVGFVRDAVAASDKAQLVVSSRSILIMICSVLLGRRPVSGGGYVEIPMEPGSLLCFAHDGDRWQFDAQSSTGEI